MDTGTETTENYKRILHEILAILEGGDVSLDFEHAPSAATTLRIITDIAGNAFARELKRLKNCGR